MRRKILLPHSKQHLTDRVTILRLLSFSALIVAAISSSLLRMRIKRAAAPLATLHSVVDTLITVAQQQVADMVFSPSYPCFLSESHLLFNINQVWQAEEAYHRVLTPPPTLSHSVITQAWSSNIDGFTSHNSGANLCYVYLTSTSHIKSNWYAQFMWTITQLGWYPWYRLHRSREHFQPALLVNLVFW